ncbi:MAG: hypothetical protein QXY62_00545 [Candidatus Altiarchaeota archaeon]
MISKKISKRDKDIKRRLIKLEKIGKELACRIKILEKKLNFKKLTKKKKVVK